MNTLISLESRAEKIKVTVKELIIHLVDGRKLEVPLAWFPKLLKATAHQRNKYRLIGDGVGVHWMDIDEDISIHGLMGMSD